MVYVLWLKRSCKLLCNVQCSLTKWVFVIYVCLLQKGCPAIVLNNVIVNYLVQTQQSLLMKGLEHLGLTEWKEIKASLT